MPKYEFEVTMIVAPAAAPKDLSMVKGKENANSYQQAAIQFRDRDENAQYRDPSMLIRATTVTQGENETGTRFFTGSAMTPQSRVAMMGKRTTAGGKSTMIAELRYNGESRYLHRSVYKGDTYVVISDRPTMPEYDERDKDAPIVHNMTVTAREIEGDVRIKGLTRKFFGKFNPEISTHEVALKFEHDPYSIDKLIARAAAMNVPWSFYPDVRTSIPDEELMSDHERQCHTAYRFFFEKESDAALFRLGCSKADVAF